VNHGKSLLSPQLFLAAETPNSRMRPSATKFASCAAAGGTKPHLQIFQLSLLSSLLLPTPPVTPSTTHTTIQQMQIERNNANIPSFDIKNQMRTGINLQKLFRNYRSQIRCDAERRRGAP
jgi:hypothetical protein